MYISLNGANHLLSAICHHQTAIVRAQCICVWLRNACYLCWCSQHLSYILIWFLVIQFYSYMLPRIMWLVGIDSGNRLISSVQIPLPEPWRSMTQYDVTRQCQINTLSVATIWIIGFFENMLQCQRCGTWCNIRSVVYRNLLTAIPFCHCVYGDDQGFAKFAFGADIFGFMLCK